MPSRTTTLIFAGIAFVGGIYGLVYLINDRPPEGLGGDPTNPQQVALGRTLYAENCASCHGANLEGETPDWRGRKADGTLPAPPHDETGHTWHHPDQLLFDYTKKGGQAMGFENFTSAMPGFGESLTDAEINAVLAYIKSHWSDKPRQRQALASQQSQSR